MKESGKGVKIKDHRNKLKLRQYLLFVNFVVSVVSCSKYILGFKPLIDKYISIMKPVFELLQVTTKALKWSAIVTFIFIFYFYITDICGFYSPSPQRIFTILLSV